METIQLRGGFTATDERLGRLPEFDARSRDYPARALLTPRQETTLRSKTWYLPLRYRLDQGDGRDIPNFSPSGCTGYSRTHDLSGSPSPVKKPDGTALDRQFAHALYRLAQTLDEWAGEAYEGSSVLGANKACRQLGFIGEYRWAFGIDDACAAISWLGSVVVGSDWLESMFYPRPSGLLEVDTESDVAGGHAYAIRGIAVSRDYKRRLLGRSEIIRNVPLLRIAQTWGPYWGINGEAFIWADDLEVLLKGVEWPGECSITTTAFKRG